MYFSKRIVVLVVSLILILSGAQFLFSGGAQEEATKEGVPGEITMIIPYSAGGGTDRTGRSIARYLEEVTDSSVVVVNREGAGGAFGMEEMIEAESTGETIGLVPYPALVMTLERTDYDPEDFDYLVSFTQTPPSLILAPDSEFKDIEELIEYAKDNPNDVTVSESGDSLLLTSILFQDEAGIDVTMVNYDGAGDSLTALLGGHVDAAFISAQFIENARSEGAKPLAIANSERIEDLSNVPTFTELGYDVVNPISRIMVAPKGVPKETRSALVDALEETAQMEELQKALSEGGEIPKVLRDKEVSDFVLTGAKRIKSLREEHSEKFERD